MKGKKDLVLKRLEGLRYRGLYFTAVHDHDPAVYHDPGNRYMVFKYRPWRFGWVRTQMNEFFFFGFCYFSWYM